MVRFEKRDCLCVSECVRVFVCECVCVLLTHVLASHPVSVDLRFNQLLIFPLHLYPSLTRSTSQFYTLGFHSISIETASRKVRKLLAYTTPKYLSYLLIDIALFSFFWCLYLGVRIGNCCSLNYISSIKTNKNPCVEVLTPLNCDHIWRQSFREIMKLKWG